jgi:hypothetical protein
MNRKNELLKRMIKEEVQRRVIKEQNEYQDVYNSIDWDRVASEIVKTIGIKAKLEFKLNRKYVDMMSNNLIDQCGIFSKAIDRCNLIFFNSQLMTDPGNNFKFWGTISLSYPGNSMNIGTVSVMQDGSIIVKPLSPKS